MSDMPADPDAHAGRTAAADVTPRHRGRLAVLGVGIMAVTLAALLTGLAHADTTRSANTTFRGTWLCNWKIDGAHVPLAGARVELLTPIVDLDDFDIVPGNFRVVKVTQTDSDGNWSFTFPFDEDGDDYWVRVLTNGNGVRMHDFLLPWPFFVDSDRNQNDVPLHDYGARVIHTYRCEVWAGLQRAYDDFVSTTGARPPYGDLDVVSHAITAGVPVTMFTEIWWPADHDVAARDARVGPSSGTKERGTGLALGYETAFHEFAHSFRHAYDAPRQPFAGPAHFFGLDVPYWEYAQQHDPCKKTNSGFAFNEGWASYWAGKYADGKAPACGGDGRDYSVEGNVTAALHRLQRLCGTTRAGMVALLAAAGPAGLPTQPVHTFDQFAAVAGRRFSAVGSCLLGKITSSATTRRQRDTQRAGTLPSTVGRLRRDLDRTVASATRALRDARLLRQRPTSCSEGACLRRLAGEIGVPLAVARLELARALRSATVSWTPRERRMLAGPPSRALVALVATRERAFRRAARTIAVRGIRDALRIGRPLARRDGSPDARAILRLLQTAERRAGSTALIPGIVPSPSLPRVTRLGPSPAPPSPSRPTPPPPPPALARPNLVVTAITGFANAADPRLSVTVRNAGEAPAPPSRLSLELHSAYDGLTYTRMIDTPEIPAGATVTMTHPCTDPYAPDRATATADALDAIDESDESDNALTVTGPPCRFN